MRSIVIFFCILVFAAPPASAGAWLRDAGTSFTAISFTTTYFRDTQNSSYLEFGLREDLTLGADISLFADRSGGQTGSATFFLRRSLGDRDSANKWAYELGAGGAWNGTAILPHLMTGLAWGRGFQAGDDSGWMGIEAQVKWDVTHSLHTIKLDSTFGYNFTDNFSTMMQLFLSHNNGRTYATLAPSLLLTPRRGKYRIQIGAESPVGMFENTALKLGLWREF